MIHIVRGKIQMSITCVSAITIVIIAELKRII